jgi:hypothetical protein
MFDLWLAVDNSSQAASRSTPLVAIRMPRETPIRRLVRRARSRWSAFSWCRTAFMAVTAAEPRRAMILSSWASKALGVVE